MEERLDLRVLGRAERDVLSRQDVRRGGRGRAAGTSSSLSKNLMERFLAVSEERLIGFGRLALAAASTAAIYLDPSQPSGGRTFVYVILMAYVAFAAILFVWSNVRRLPATAQLSTHLIDIVLVSMLLHFTEGPTSPFFVFFCFLLLAATLRWDWRGALGTGALLVSLLGLLTMADAIQTDTTMLELDRLIMRATYLVIASGLFAYFGAFRSRNRMRLTSLAAWPSTSTSSSPRRFPELEASFSCAVQVTGASRIVAIWDQWDEPYRFYAEWEDGQTRYGVANRKSREPRRTEEAEGEIEERFSIAPPEDSAVIAEIGLASPPTSITQFQNASSHGRVYLYDAATASSEDLLLTKIIGSRIGTDIEKHIGQSQLEEAASSHERMRLAQELHDGILQSLTAVRLQLHLVRTEIGGVSFERLDSIAKTLEEEQRRIRKFVERSRPIAADEKQVDAEAFLKQIAAYLTAQWNIHISVHTAPPYFCLSRASTHQIERLLAESVSNAVRHGSATKIDLSLQETVSGVALGVWNNGDPFPGLVGTFSSEDLRRMGVGPTSLLWRVSDCAGEIVLSSGPDGISIEVELPVA